MNAIDWSLYAILDQTYLAGRPLESLIEAAVAGGAGIIQLRYKSYHSAELYEAARQARAVTRRLGVPLIINDRLDVALAVQADGVHLGQEDLPHAVARDRLGRERWLGVSVHSLEEFERSRPANPDYYGVGTIYPSGTKETLPVKGIEVVRQLRPLTDKPLVAIGGLTPENLAPVIQAGADGVAVISALWRADDVEARAREFVEAIAAARTPSAA